MADSWVEIKSDGNGTGTKAILVVRASAGGEVRYVIPNVTQAEWSVTARGVAVLQLTIAGAVADVRAQINTSSTSVEDLLTEIVAGRLARDKDEPGGRYIVGNDPGFDDARTRSGMPIGNVVEDLGDGRYAVELNCAPKDDDLP